ncbi:DUF790 family protein [Leptolyngbyaceae cyanobacterium UHCC 1019]
MQPVQATQLIPLSVSARSQLIAEYASLVTVPVELHFDLHRAIRSPPPPPYSALLPEYLQKKFYQVQQSGRDDLVLAISERLNLEKAGVNFSQTPARLVWFKDQLSLKAVLEVVGRE